jgi:cell wall-associated NlpC family hydrolase
LGILAALLAAVPAFADPSISSKQAEAQRVMGELQQLDSSLERAVEQYHYATLKLERIRRAQKQNGYELGVAQRNLKRSQQVIAQRLVTLYTSDQNSTLEVILGAKSLDDILSRVDAATRVSSLDTRVLHEVRTFRTAVKKHQRELAAAKKQQDNLVAERASQRNAIESRLAERRRFLASVKSEIVQLQAQQHARELQMARAAQERLASHQREAQQAAESTVVGATAEAVGSTAETEGVTVAPPPTHGGVVGVAMSYLGTPYVWGGGSPGGFDCSGLVAYSYAQVGVSLPHSSYAQYSAGVPVSRDQLQPGDLVFFDGLGHVGIYIGGDQFVHAPHSGDVVKVSSLGESWYASTYVGARRIL